LKTLRCDDNNLTSLDITNNPDITFLNCSFNKIRTLFMKNGNDNLSGSFAFSNPYLEFVCCNESQLEQVKEALEFYGHDLGITVATSDCLLSICP
jgi:Leucine-rich repeat (LRR) protein